MAFPWFEQDDRPNVLLEGACFHMHSKDPFFGAKYLAKDKNGKVIKTKDGEVLKRKDLYIIVRMIHNDVADEQPSLMVIRERDWESMKADLNRWRARKGLDPADFDSWYAEILDNGVRVWEV